MKKYVTGCIYAVDLHGKEDYEFKGVHPAMVVRMLKEEKMYYVVPLTTYTKERWEKCKRIGFGCRIESTNSIARIDKLNVITEKQIQNRYYNAGRLVCAKPEEIKKVMLRVEEYVKLTNQKGLNEYNKYFSAKEKLENSLEKFFVANSFSEVCYPVSFEQDNIEVTFCKNDITRLTARDVEQVLCDLLGASRVEVKNISEKQIVFKITLDEAKVLTFKEKYDKFKTQKGDGDM